jgi:hypothetical protein
VVEEREVPVTVRRAVVEKYEVPVQRWVEHEEVREIPIETRRIRYEEVEEPVKVKVLRTQVETKTVREPKTVGEWVRYESTERVPRTVVSKIPVDAYGRDLVPSSSRRSEVKVKKAEANGKSGASSGKKAESTEEKKGAASGDGEASDGKASSGAAGDAGKSEANDKSADGTSSEGDKTPKDSDPTGKPRIEPEMQGPQLGGEKSNESTGGSASKTGFTPSLIRRNKTT